jgi:hypothetical protein
MSPRRYKRDIVLLKKKTQLLKRILVTMVLHRLSIWEQITLKNLLFTIKTNLFNETLSGLMGHLIHKLLFHEWHSYRVTVKQKNKQTPWPESASDRRLSAKLVPISAGRGCREVSTTDPHGRILDFLDRSRYFFFQVAPQMYSQG